MQRKWRLINVDLQCCVKLPQTGQGGFFSYKMINKGIGNYLLKKKTPKENLSQSNVAI